MCSGYYIFWCSMCQKTKIPLFSCFHFKATFGPFLTTISLLVCMIKSTSAYGVKIKAKIKFVNKTKLLFLDDIDLRLEKYCLRKAKRQTKMAESQVRTWPIALQGPIGFSPSQLFINIKIPSNH